MGSASGCGKTWICSWNSVSSAVPVTQHNQLHSTAQPEYTAQLLNDSRIAKVDVGVGGWVNDAQNGIGCNGCQQPTTEIREGQSREEGGMGSSWLCMHAWQQA